MTDNISKSLRAAIAVLRQADRYAHIARILNYDLETICPEKGMEEESGLIAFMENQAFRLTKKKDFIRAAENLYAHREELELHDRALAESLHRTWMKEKNITPAQQKDFAETVNHAYVAWSKAKTASDYSVFAPSLHKIRDMSLQQIRLRENPMPDDYDNLLDDYERGITSADLDEIFGTCLERLVPLLEKIRKSRRQPRTDFLSRFAPAHQQRILAKRLLEIIGFDFTRGAFTTTEHPFTDGLGRNDIRITTKYDEHAFASNLYTIVHEGGHALFEMNQPQENYDHFLNRKTMGMHESVSRFYENRIGRSRAFIHLIYDDLCRLLPEVTEGVSEQELYEGLNAVQPSLIRTEADEFTYTFHIIIRYELEKEIIAGTARIEDLPQLWNDRYEKYLGIRPDCDRNGILQDVHWASGFGYFPTYALGNIYNSMYYNKMAETIDIDDAVCRGRFDLINGWMKEHVWAKADLLAPKEWIRDITGRTITPDDFLDYLEDKYSEIYDL